MNAVPNLPPSGPNRSPSPVVETPDPGPTNAVTPDQWFNVAFQSLELAREVAVEALIGVRKTVAQTAVVAQRRATYRLARAYETTAKQTQQLAGQARKQWDHAVEDYPLETVGAAAATAFLAGIILRAVRSSRYE